MHVRMAINKIARNCKQWRGIDKETSYTVGGNVNVNWYSNYGTQYGDSSPN